jgi:hypothetical protein
VSAKARQPSGKIALQVKISLRHTEPIVWRRVLVPGAMPLDKFHSVIQAVVGWEDRHPHVFEILGERYGPQNFEWEEEERDLDEEGVRLHVLLDQDDRFTYEYDFGDGWVHDLEVERVETVDTPLLQAVCLDGSMACPPEDTGGTSGFAAFVEIMADPTHRNHSEKVTWFGGLFNPEDFSLSKANARLQRLPR